jgi:thioredoxin 1
MNDEHSAPTRADLDASRGELVLEFGASWCPICANAKPDIEQALGERPGVRHQWVEDGPGRPLGRSFRVKLWPTLVVLRDGQEVGRVVRPADVAAVRSALAALDAR